MSLRMEKYENSNKESFSRTKRNQHIYNSNDMSDFSRIKTNTNVSVISDAKKEIDIDKIKKIINKIDAENEVSKRNTSISIPNNEEKKEVTRIELKHHDINTVLENAKEKQEIDYEDQRHRQIGNTGYNILKEINIYDNNNNNIDKEVKEDTEDLNTNEKTIVDLIKDIKNQSTNKEKNDDELTKEDLFQELMGDNENTVVMPALESEKNHIDDKDNLKELLLNMTSDLENIKLQNKDMTKTTKKDKNKKISEIDKSFYTNSMTFDKHDFEGIDDFDDEYSKSNKYVKIIVIIIILVLLISIFFVLNSIYKFI